MTGLGLVLLTSSSQANPPVIEVATGDSVSIGLNLDVSDEWMVALDGGLVLPVTEQVVFSQPGRKLVYASAPGKDGQWFDVRVQGEALEQASTTLHVDTSPPTARFQYQGPRVSASEGDWIATGTVVTAQYDDPAGFKSGFMSVDGEDHGSSVSGLSAGSHQITAHGTDRAGNTGDSGKTTIRVDHQGPEIQWQILDQGWPAADGGRVYQSPVKLRVTASDAESGLAALSAGVAGAIKTGDSIEIADSQVTLTATDRVGNQHSLTANWRYDSSPPSLRVEFNGAEQPVEGVLGLKVGDRIALIAEDVGVGVATAEYRYNGGPWIALPEYLRFDTQGRYQLELRATDQVGHQASASWSVRAAKSTALEPGVK
jgi:hypothetical protein